MKSIKPGRGPSMMSGISSLFAALFGVVWIYIALRGGAGPFALFGVVFIVMALTQAWYSFHNASQKERFSSFDIVDSREEMDPLDPRYSDEEDYSVHSADTGSHRFCPYCGTPLQSDYQFCPECGKKLH